MSYKPPTLIEEVATLSHFKNFWCYPYKTWQYRTWCFFEKLGVVSVPPEN